MKRGRIQCKDIPDELVLQAVADTTTDAWGIPIADSYGSWRRWSDVLEQFDRLMPDVNRPLFFAKVDRLSDRGLLHACVHQPYRKGQCRGNIHLPEECRGC